MTASLAWERTIAENNAVRAALLRDGYDPDDPDWPETSTPRWVRPMAEVLPPHECLADGRCNAAASWPEPFPWHDARVGALVGGIIVAGSRGYPT